LSRIGDDQDAPSVELRTYDTSRYGPRSATGTPPTVSPVNAAWRYSDVLETVRPRPLPGFVPEPRIDLAGCQATPPGGWTAWPVRATLAPDGLPSRIVIVAAKVPSPAGAMKLR
jgi:hypothetical protein